MLDHYIFGRTERISPEAPVPVVHFEHEEHRVGGAGSVAANLAALRADVKVIGIVGADEAGAELRRRLADCGACVDHLVEAAGRPTVTKVRVMGSSQERTPQQMLRLDYENTLAVDSATAQRLIDAVAAALDHTDLICIEDYNKGVVTPDVCHQVIAMARSRRIPVIVDPANLADYAKYAGATAIKPNRPEAERSTGLMVRTEADYAPAAEQMLQHLDLEAVVITLNEAGCYLATADGQRRWLRTRPRQVADATGAGDMVLATLGVARAAGASWEDAAALSNVAAGLEVERLGCVPVTPQEIIDDLIAEGRLHLGKERPLEKLLAELQHHRANGKRIVFTNGCFDLIHLGHVKYFQFAKAQGDLLVVGVNTDASIRRLKGPKRPIIHEDDRISVLEELESIDYLVRFDDDTPLELIRQIRPDVLVKGADYAKEQIVGWEIVEACGGRIALAPLIDGRSTTGVIQRILDAHGDEPDRLAATGTRP
jgi:D-beta-D-heptose 7-phosphate kinase/D-beta-D-heptose 1-phosphate adenosyltransferase